jgi:hypothetical protein
MSRPAAGIPGNVKDLLTSGLARPCRYAGSRPGCQLLAVVCYGPVALCPACDQRRSTLGKGQAPARLPDPAVLLDITAARDTFQQAEAALRQAVDRARQAGHPWSAVAAVLAVSRQAAWQRFARGHR